MQIPFHSNASLANAPQNVSICCLADSRYLSTLSPLSAIKWLFTDLSIDSFKSFKSFTNESPWDNGIANINVPLLRALGMSESRCYALEHGFDLGFTCDPPVQTSVPKNYSSIDGFGEIIQQKLLNDISVGTLEIFDVSKVMKEGKSLLFHPLGAVPKGLDDCRIIVDTSITGLNDSLLSPPLAFPNLKSLLNGTRPLGYGCSFDLSSYFHQLKVRDDQVNFLCITLPDGTTARYRKICFGLRPAPFLAQGTTVELRDLAIKWDVLQGASMVFVDDFSSSHDDGEILAAVRLAFIAFMGILGFILHPDKQPFPSQIFKALGFTIDTVNLKLSISGDKQAKRLILIKEVLKSLLENGFVTLNQAQCLVGKLTHSAIVVLTGRFHISPWWSAIAKSEREYRCNHNLPVTATAPKQTRIMSSQPLIDSLIWWQGALSDNDKISRNLCVKSDGFLDIFDEESLQGIHSMDSSSIINSSLLSMHNGVAIDILIDASPIGYGASIELSNGHKLTIQELFHPDLWFSEQIQLEITSVFSTLSNILDRFSCLAPPKIPKFILIKSDCPTLVSLINDWSFKSETIKSSLGKLASISFDHNCQLVATLVSRNATAIVHDMASPSCLSITRKSTRNINNAIDSHFKQNYNPDTALLLHRDSLKHIIQSKHINGYSKLVFFSKHRSLIFSLITKHFTLRHVTPPHTCLLKFGNKFKTFSFLTANITSKL